MCTSGSDKLLKVLSKEGCFIYIYIYRNMEFILTSVCWHTSTPHFAVDIENAQWSFICYTMNCCSYTFAIKVPYYIKITLYSWFFFNWIAIEAFSKRKGLFSSVIMLCFHILYQYQLFTTNNYQWKIVYIILSNMIYFCCTLKFILYFSLLCSFKVLYFEKFTILILKTAIWHHNTDF